MTLQMSGWVLALGMAASYLMMKNNTMQMTMLEQARTQFHASAKPETTGATSQAIREVQATVPKGTRFEDMNLKTPLVERQGLERAQLEEQGHVAAYENAAQLPEIHGVYFVQGSGF
jgi:hypothetical protein